MTRLRRPDTRHLPVVDETSAGGLW